MVTKHLIKLSYDLIIKVDNWAVKAVADKRFKNKYSSHGAEENPDVLRTSKLSEYAFAQWAKLPPSAVKLDQFEPDFDVAVAGHLVEVRSCELWKKYLCWPAKKVEKFTATNFTLMVLVKFDEPDFLIAGWITKQRFFKQKIIATASTKPPLVYGTWHIHEDNLDEMDFFPLVEERLVHYCHCGKWGAFGFGVNLRSDHTGVWFCHEHRPR